MAYKSCDDCGTKLDHGICPNCNEMDIIRMQEDWDKLNEQEEPNYDGSV